jgi:hypothetical protein
MAALSAGAASPPGAPDGAAALEVRLDGVWSAAYGSSGESPPAAGWFQTDVPGFLSSRADQPHLWYEKEFELPSGFPAAHNVLRFEGVKFGAAVYLNGTCLGSHVDGFTPFEVEVPAALLQAHNVLRVRSSSFLAAMDPSAQPPPAWDPEEAKDAFLYSLGSQPGYVGIWQGVTLLGFSDARITGVFLRTSVKSRTLTVDVSVRNLSDAPFSAALKSEVLDGSAAVLALPDTALELGPGEEKTVRVSQAWPSPRLWSPDDPHLYLLRASVPGVHETATRFGFREFAVEGREFHLNGIPIKLRATAAHPFAYSKTDALAYLKLAKEGHNVAMRLHAQPWPRSWYEAADEVGILLVWESAYFCWGPAYRLEDPAFWAHYRENLRGQLTLHRNSPSVVIWSLENELLLCSGLRPGETPRMAYAESRLGEMADLARELDPTRPVMFEGDGDPAGKADIFNLHYPHEYPRWTLWPEEAWWLPDTVETDIYPGGIPPWPISKPLYIGEFAWVPPQTGLEASALFFGDRIYRDLSGRYLDGKARVWDFQIEAYRALGVQGMDPWNIWEGDFVQPNAQLYDLVKEKYAPNGLYLREKGARFFSGERVQRTADLFNDTLAAADLQLVCELSVEGKRASRFKKRVQLQPAQSASFTVSLKAPKVKAATDGTLSCRVERGGQTCFRWEVPVRVFPREHLTSSVPLLLYDPASNAAPALSSAGLSFTPVAGLEALPPGAFLLVGPGGLDGPSAWRALVRFAAQGGRVLVLPHDGLPAGLPFSLAGSGAHALFPVSEEHPVFSSLRGEDLQLWSGDHRAVRAGLVLPQEGSYELMATAYAAEGALAALVEVPSGTGSILFCQADVLAKLESEPAGRRLLQNLLNHLASALPAPGRLSTVGLSEPERNVLLCLGLQEDPSPPAGYRGVLAGPELDPSALPALLDGVRGGAFLWLHKPRDAHLAALEASGLGVETREAPRGIVLGEPALTRAGVPDHSLFWAGEFTEQYWAFPRLTEDFAARLFEAPEDWGGARIFPASEFTVTGSGEPAGDGTVILYGNGALALELDVAAEGLYDLGVLARGTPVDGEYPILQVEVDGEGQGYLGAGAELAVSSLRLPLAAGTRRLRLTFINDSYDPPEDRNLLFAELRVKGAPASEAVQRLTQPAALVRLPHGAGFVLLDDLNWELADAQPKKQAFLATLLRSLGVSLDPSLSAHTLEAEDMDVVSGSLVYKMDTGVVLASSGAVAGSFTLPEGGTCLIKLAAWGTPVAGVYPLAEIAVDGSPVGRLTAGAETPGSYALEAVLGEGAHTLSVSFVNDAYAPPEDRNLFVDKVVVSLRG